MKIIIVLSLLIHSLAYGKTVNLNDLKFPISLFEFKSKIKLNSPKMIPAANKQELMVDKNLAFIIDHNTVVNWFEYKTEYVPENTTFIFMNSGKIFASNYQVPKRVFLKMGMITKENAVDRFLYASLFTMFNKEKIEVVDNQTSADEVITIDASVYKMPANYMRRIYLMSTDKNQKKLWEVEIKSPGKLDGIRRMVPSMILSSQNFIMKNENEKKLEISGIKVRDFFYEIVAMNLGTKYSIINF